MLDILVTVGVILVLIALAALLLHLINTHHQQRIATTHYERFHPGSPPETPGGRAEGTGDRAGRHGQEERKGREGEGGGDPPPPPPRDS